MKKITIRFKKIVEGYSVSWRDGRPRRRERAELLFQWVEKKLLGGKGNAVKTRNGARLSCDKVTQKIVVDVKTYRGTALENWGTYTCIYEACYVLLCFIEDWIPRSFLHTKTKQYMPFILYERH